MQCSHAGVTHSIATGVSADVLPQLQPQHIVTLLQAALAAGKQQGTGQRMRMLCKLPAAQAVDADSACSLLMLAVQHPDAEAMEALCSLAGTQQLDDCSISSLLAGALTSGSQMKVEMLAHLPAAQSMQADMLLPLAAAAMHSTGTAKWQPLQVLLKLPAAAELSRADIDKLLRAAAEAVTQHGCSCVAHVSALVEAPGAGAASTEALLSALLAVLKHSGCHINSWPQHTQSCRSGCHAVVKLCNVLVKQHHEVQAAAIAGVLQAAQRTQRCSSVWQLLDLPQAMDLQEGLVAGFVKQVLQDDAFWHVMVGMCGGMQAWGHYRQQLTDFSATVGPQAALGTTPASCLNSGGYM
jgi:hypothetical protein